MKTYGETETTDVIGILSDLRWYVSLVSQLPDPTTEYENVTFVLEKPQQGYIATHVYFCTRNDDDELYWKDLSAPDSMPIDSTCSAGFDIVTDSNGVYQQRVSWTSPTDRTLDKWVADMLVLKEDGHPTCLTDGRLVVVSSTRDEFSDVSFMTSFISNYTNQQNASRRIFHLFQSGQMTYTDPEPM